MDNLGRRGRPHPLDPAAVRASSPSSARSTSRWRSPAGPTAAPSWPATRSSSSRASAGADVRLNLLSEAYRDAGMPGGRLQPGHGPGRDGRARSSRRTRAIDGIVFTGSYRGRLRPLPALLDAVPAAVHRGDGRQEPGDRDRPGRPRGGGRGHHARRPSASAARSARPTAGSTSSGRSTTSSSACWSRRPRRSPIGDPLQRENWLGPVIDQRAVDRYQQAVGRGAPGRHASSPAASA